MIFPQLRQRLPVEMKKLKTTSKSVRGFDIECNEQVVTLRQTVKQLLQVIRALGARGPWRPNANGT